MNKDLIVHLRLKGRGLKDISEEVGHPVSVVHLFFKKYMQGLVNKWVDQSLEIPGTFNEAYENFDLWCGNNGHTPITIKDFKSVICMLENRGKTDLLSINPISDGSIQLLLDVSKLKGSFG